LRHLDFMGNSFPIETLQKLIKSIKIRQNYQSPTV